MKKHIICLLCAAVIVTGLFSACGKVDTEQKPPEQPTSTEQSAPAETQNTDAVPESAYWKTAGFDGVENETGDFWSDLFLWEDGTGWFRFSQATPSSNFYGIHDVASCDWSLEDSGMLTLFSQETKAVLYTGVVADGVLTIHYDGYTKEDIRMEQAEMPPYGSHWSILDLYGTWKMVSYSDADSGYHATSRYTIGGADGYFASEITLEKELGAYFWLADPVLNRLEAERNMGLGYYDDDDYTWHPYTEGPIWEGCANEAWHAELTRISDPNIRFYVTYADGRLLLKKDDVRNPNSFPSSFTAEFEYVGYTGDLGEGSGIDIVNNRYAEVAYSVIIGQYRAALQYFTTSEDVADFLVRSLKIDANIDDEELLRGLYTSVDEPLRYGGDCNFGYAMRDINEDGMPELFILSEDEYWGDYTITAFYTLCRGRPTLVGAYWSRNRCTLGIDGTVYIEGSSGAYDSFSASFALNSETGRLQLIEMIDFFNIPDVTPAEAGLAFAPIISTPTNGVSGTENSQADKVAVYIFSSIVGYNGKVYSIYASPEIPNFIGISGSKKFTPLPEPIGKSMESQGMYVQSFTIYQDKIYYLAAEPGSDITPGKLFRCDLDGSRNEWLADAGNFSTCMISDGLLYFDAEAEGGDFGIIAIDLDENRFVFDCEFPDIAEPGISEYNGFVYYFSDGTLYKKDIRTEFASEIMTLKPGPMNTYGDGSVIAVVGDTVYYATLGEYGDNGNVYLLGVSVHGGTSELLASWFRG